MFLPLSVGHGLHEMRVKLAAVTRLFFLKIKKKRHIILMLAASHSPTIQSALLPSGAAKGKKEQLGIELPLGLMRNPQ